VIGPNAREARYCGGGSAALRPYRAVSILDAIRSMGLDVRYAPGCQSFHQLPVLGDNVRTREGKVGSFHFRVYKQPLDRSEQPLEEFELDDSNIVLFDYKNHEIHNDILYAQLDALLCIDETGEYEFGLTVSGKAKLYIDGDLVVDNSVNQVGGESFFGSGTIEGRARKLLDPSRSYTLRVDFSSAPTSELQASGSPTFGPGGLRLGCARIITEDEEIARATQVARDADQVVLCCGLNGDWESEGSDRLSMDLPSAQIRLISEVCAANPRTVVVNQSGCPVGGPWDDVPAFIQAWYGGNQTGDALADVLFGKASPSGKLPLSWPRQTSDNPSYLNHRSDEGRCIYGEDIFVGYRYYEKVNRAVQWPFGFGLSFVKLELSNLSARHEHDHASNGLYTKIHVSVDVTNSSALVCGAEVVQLYVQAPATSRVSRAVKELKGFAKVKVMPNETKKVTVTITSKHAFSFWSEKCNRWVMEKGAYQLLVGSSSSYTPLTESVHVYETLEWEGL
jgi:beta-glucosidase